MKITNFSEMPRLMEEIFNDEDTKYSIDKYLLHDITVTGTCRGRFRTVLSLILSHINSSEGERITFKARGNEFDGCKILSLCYDAGEDTVSFKMECNTVYNERLLAIKEVTERFSDGSLLTAAEYEENKALFERTDCCKVSIHGVNLFQLHVEAHRCFDCRWLSNDTTIGTMRICRQGSFVLDERQAKQYQNCPNWKAL